MAAVDPYPQMGCGESLVSSIPLTLLLLHHLKHLIHFVYVLGGFFIFVNVIYFLLCVLLTAMALFSVQVSKQFIRFSAKFSWIWEMMACLSKIQQP